MVGAQSVTTKTLKYTGSSITYNNASINISQNWKNTVFCDNLHHCYSLKFDERFTWSLKEDPLLNTTGTCRLLLLVVKVSSGTEAGEGTNNTV